MPNHSLASGINWTQQQSTMLVVGDVSRPGRLAIIDRMKRRMSGHQFVTPSSTGLSHQQLHLWMAPNNLNEGFRETYSNMAE